MAYVVVWFFKPCPPELDSTKFLASRSHRTIRFETDASTILLVHVTLLAEVAIIVLSAFC